MKDAYGEMKQLLMKSMAECMRFSEDVGKLEGQVRVLGQMHGLALLRTNARCVDDGLPQIGAGVHRWALMRR